MAFFELETLGCLATGSSFSQQIESLRIVGWPPAGGGIVAVVVCCCFPTVGHRLAHQDGRHTSETMARPEETRRWVDAYKKNSKLLPLVLSCTLTIKKTMKLPELLTHCTKK